MIPGVAASRQYDDGGGGGGDYDHTETYSGSFGTDNWYWVEESPGAPTTPDTQYIEDAYMWAQAVRDADDDDIGYYYDNMSQQRGKNTNPASSRKWKSFRAGVNDYPIDCSDDWGVHGSDSAPTPDVYPRVGTNAALYTSSSGSGITWGSSPNNKNYTVYRGNYLNWLNA